VVNATVGVPARGRNLAGAREPGGALPRACGPQWGRARPPARRRL